MRPTRTALLVTVLVAATLGFAGRAVAAAPSSVPTDTVACGREATRAAVRTFFTAFNAGDFARLDALFAPEPAFQWYSTPAPGERLGPPARRRETLIPYLRRRHARGDRFDLDAFHWNGRSSHWSNFAFEARGSSPAFHGGNWFRADGKGVAVCGTGAAQLIVLTFGEPGAG